MLTPWLLGDPAPHSQLPRLFCVPHAGGGVSSFMPWRKIATRVQVEPVCLPGRERRIAEPPQTSMDRLVEDMAAGLQPFLEAPFGLFGHSMGALVVFELAYRLEQIGLAPSAVVVSGRTPPSLPEVHQRLHELPTDELTAVLQEIAATPPEVLSNPELLAVVLPAVRADFELVGTYRYDHARRIRSPLVAYFGADDPWGEQQKVAMWRNLTTGPFRSRGFPGDHFFPFADQRAQVVADLEVQLLADP